MRDIHVSVVSHGQQDLVRHLIADLRRLDCADRLRLTLTLNIPEDDVAFDGPMAFPVDVVRNPHPLGFAQNHNQAFRRGGSATDRRFFVVLNPDVRIADDVFTPCARWLDDEAGIGVIAPSVLAPDGSLEDSARYLPTFGGLLRKLFGDRNAWPRDTAREITFPDWFAGIFMMFPVAAFDGVGGFDARYHLYYEDVDICSRLWLRGRSVGLLQSCTITHAARRSSRTKFVYLKWHLTSIARFLLSRVYRRTRALHAQRGGNTR
jgi:GT2 family glycosyltransferase